MPKKLNQKSLTDYLVKSQASTSLSLKNRSRKKSTNIVDSSTDEDEHDLVNEIPSDSDDDISLSLARKSQTVGVKDRKKQTRRPLKKPKFDHSSTGLDLAANSQRKQLNTNTESWIEKYRPRSSSELAIHAKKISELKTAVMGMVQMSGNRLLILSGPAGCGKTISLFTIAKELGYDISRDAGNDADSNCGSIIEWESPDRLDGVSLPQAFSEFLSGLNFRRQFNSNKTRSKRTMAVVEDLPNLLHLDTKLAFNNALLQWVNTPASSLSALPMLILIITEVEIFADNNRNDSFIVERILSKPLLNHPGLARIKFGAVNMTLISKTLKSIQQKEYALFRNIPKKEISDTINSLSALGDIRSAISAFEFWARWRFQSLKYIPMGRESHLGLFHAVGRVIYGSHKDKKGEPTMDDETLIRSVVDDWENSNRDSSFSLALLENFTCAKECRMNNEGLYNCEEVLSSADILQSEDMQTTICELIVRGLRYNITSAEADSRQKSTFKKMAYPRERKVQQSVYRSQRELDAYKLDRAKTTSTMMSYLDSLLFHGYYESYLARFRKYRDNSIICRQRPGGRIGSGFIHADDDIEESLAVQPASPIIKDSDGDAVDGMMFTDDEVEESDSD